MDKRGGAILCAITALFAVFILGIFCGRQLNPESSDVTPLPTVSRGGMVSDVSAAEPAQNDGKININTAGLSELTSLPGIGEVLALRIISYREENGNFSNIYEITKVEGIGEGKLSKIIDLITVGG